VVVARGHQDQAVDASRGERVHERLLPVGALVEARRKHRDAELLGDVLSSAMQCRVERVGHVRQQEAERERAAVGAAQAPRCQVASVVELVHRPLDPRGGGRGHVRLAVDDP
jgi:hypothetical protein